MQLTALWPESNMRPCDSSVDIAGPQPMQVRSPARWSISFNNSNAVANDERLNNLFQFE
jgi:hypothetical protein